MGGDGLHTGGGSRNGDALKGDGVPMRGDGGEGVHWRVTACPRGVVGWDGGGRVALEGDGLPRGGGGVVEVPWRATACPREVGCG